MAGGWFSAQFPPPTRVRNVSYKFCLVDPIRNPYAPGAGTPPPELAGRDDIRESARIALERTKIGRPTKSMLMVGLRGVGKTVLLDLMREQAEASGIYALRIEAPENRSLPAMLVPQLRVALLRLSNKQAAKQLAQRALRGLAGFVGALKVKYIEPPSKLFSSYSQPANQQRHDLEPKSRRHRVHRPHVRPIHAAHHARR